MRFFHDSILLRKDSPKIHQEMRKYVDKDQVGNCEWSVANRTLNGASQEKLNQGPKAYIPKISFKYLLIHFLICNFSLPCTPFENLS